MIRHSALLLLLATAVRCATVAPATTPQTELAVVNGHAITVSDVLDEFTKRHGGHTKFLGGDVELRKFVDVVIDQHLMIEEAYQLGLDRQGDISAAVADLTEKKSVELLLERELEDKSNPTPDEVRAAWEKNTTSVVQIRQIVVDTRSEAEEIRAALMSGTDFDALARMCSLSRSRMRGGRLQPMGWGSMEIALEQAVFGMEPGQISPPIETNEGWQIVQLEAVTPMPRADFARAESKVRDILRRRQLDERVRDLSNELWTKYHVETFLPPGGAAQLAALRTRKPDTVIAAWEGGKLTLQEFATEQQLGMVSRLPFERANKEVMTQLRKTVNQPLVKLEARARQLGNVPEVATVVQRRQEELMHAALFDQHVMKGVDVAEEEVAAYHAAHPEEFVAPEKRRVSHLVVSTEEEAGAAAKRIAEGEPFAEVAKSVSLDVMSKAAGGDLGWITEQTTPKEFKRVLSLPLGELSAPIKSEYGWHVVTVTEIQEKKPLTLDETKEEIRNKVMQQKQRERRQRWLGKLRQNAKIEIRDASVRQYVKENAFETNASASAAPGHGASAH
jgi:parvulin-like peptidyl-prolyl isomerase